MINYLLIVCTQLYIFAVADVAIAVNVTGDESLIVRHWPSTLNININLTNVEGLDVPPIAGGTDNYVMHIFFSDANCSETSMKCTNISTNYLIGNPVELDLALTVNGTRGLEVAITEEIMIEMCDWIEFICVWIYPATYAEYADLNPENDMSCMVVPKLCTPGNVLF